MNRTTQQLLQRLGDPDPQVRKRAAEALGRIGDPHAVGPLLRSLADPDPPVRQAVEQALSRIRAEGIGPYLKALHRGDLAEKQAALEALGDLQDPRSVEALLEVARSDAALRVPAVEALLKFDGYVTDRALVRALRMPDPDVCQTTAQTLGRSGARGVRPLLLALAESGSVDTPLLQEALQSIGEEAVAPLVQALSSEEPALCRAAVRALGWIGASARDALLQTMRRADLSARVYAAEALALVQASDAIRELIQMIQDEEEETQSVVAQALARLGQTAVDPLIQALKDPDSHVRTGAVHALRVVDAVCAAQDPRTVSALLEALQDESPFVRRAVVESLGRIGAPEAVAPLTAALYDPNGGVRRATVETLGQYDDLRAAETLLFHTLRDEFGYIRQAAEHALDRMVERRRIDLTGSLTRALQADDPNVRQYAAAALGRTGDERAVGPLLAALAGTDEIVRRSAEASLLALSEPEPLLRAVFAATHLSPQERYRALEALRLPLYLPEIPRLCQQMMAEEDEAVREGARQTLEYCTLMRAARQETAADAQHLLRPASGATGSEPPEQLLKPADPPR